MYVLIPVLAGFVIGIARGGRPRNLSDVALRSMWLLGAGLALQVVSEIVHLPSGVDYGVVVGSYAALAAFAARNMSLRGMGLVALGLSLNIVPIVVNHGMPVRGSAIVSAGIAAPDRVAGLGFGGKRHLERRSDRVMVLADVLPDRAFHEVLSWGDLVMGVGIAATLSNMLLPRSRRRTSRLTRSRGQPVA